MDPTGVPHDMATSRSGPRIPVIAILMIGAFHTGFAAGGANDLELCAGLDVNDDKKRHHCTLVIEIPNLSGAARAVALFHRGNFWQAQTEYERAIEDFDSALRLSPQAPRVLHNRGNAWQRKGDYDRALKDYDAALQMDPNYASAYNNRGNVWLQKGDFGRARDDYGEALRLNPKYMEAFTNRGFVHFYQGSFVLAARDFSFARELDPRNVYAVIWQSLSRARSARGSRAEIPSADTSGGLASWPWPIVHFLAGRLSADQVIRATAHSDAAVRTARQCEANFYIGQSYLAQAMQERAIEGLVAARASCPKDFIEYHGAVAELRRLKR